MLFEYMGAEYLITRVIKWIPRVITIFEQRKIGRTVD